MNLDLEHMSEVELIALAIEIRIFEVIMEEVEKVEMKRDMNLIANSLNQSVEYVGKFIEIDQLGNILPTKFGKFCLMILNHVELDDENVVTLLELQHDVLKMEKQPTNF